MPRLGLWASGGVLMAGLCKSLSAFFLYRPNVQGKVDLWSIRVVGTEEGIMEFKVNIANRKTFPAMGFR